uniref:Uncharacterized protein n=1 Tax=Davidia involucrata TaxID=16924 RepID=A0A5B7AZ24_DAVIN
MLESLDLSRNQISGEIPTGLADLNFLSVMDLSNNNLSGRIPSSTQLQSFNASSYTGNRELCGLPLPNKCLGDETALGPPTTDHGKDNDVQEDDDSFITTGFYVSVVLGFVFGFWGVFGTLLLKNSWRHAYFKFFERHERLALRDNCGDHGQIAKEVQS